MPRFFVYEEYGAKYESMMGDMAATSKQIPTWQAYERSIELLAHSLVPSRGHELRNRKGLTFEDLLIKVRSHRCPRALLISFWQADSTRLQVPTPIRGLV